MTETTRALGQFFAAVIETLGVVTIFLFVVYGIWTVSSKKVRGLNLKEAVAEGRRSIGRGILLGLEFLVAADIIHTVAVNITYASVGLLAVIVLIRTFLSFTLDVEITGSWPWDKKLRS